MREHDRRLGEVARALADPLRLVVLRHLKEKPATVSEICALTGQSQSNVSNHLAVMRAGGLVGAKREGRQRVYGLRDATVERLVDALAEVAGTTPHSDPGAPLAISRTCYDHLAGRVGVALFDALVARRAIREPEEGGGAVELGPEGAEVFGDLGVDVEAAGRERRRFARACSDWTERKPHLGGALGAALWAALVERGWAVGKPGTREVTVTEEGEAALQRELGLEY